MSSNDLTEIQVTLPENTALIEKQMAPIPPAGYIAVDMAPIKQLLEMARQDIDYALSYAGIAIADRTVQAETATGRLLDNQELMTNVMKFSGSIFYLLRRVYEAIAMLRYPLTVIEVPEVIEPTNFSFRTPEMLTNELATAKQAGLPDVAQYNIVSQYLDARFPGDNWTQRRFDVIAYVDALWNLASDTIVMLKSVNVVSQLQAVIHVNIGTYLSQIQGWETMENEAIKAEVTRMAQMQVDSMAVAMPSLDMPVVEDEGEDEEPEQEDTESTQMA
jgi:hypothetical protein